MVNTPFDQHCVYITEEAPGSSACWRGLDHDSGRQHCAASDKLLVGQQAEQTEAPPALAQSRVYARLAVLTKSLGPQRLIHRLGRTSCLQKVTLLSLSPRPVNRPATVFFSGADSG